MKKFNLGLFETCLFLLWKHVYVYMITGPKALEVWAPRVLHLAFLAWIHIQLPEATNRAPQILLLLLEEILLDK